MLQLAAIALAVVFAMAGGGVFSLYAGARRRRARERYPELTERELAGAATGLDPRLPLDDFSARQRPPRP